MKTKMQTCGSCGKAIYFLKHVRSGLLAPIEAEPLPGGNIRIELDADSYTVLRKTELEAQRLADPHGVLHVNHYMRCPQRAAWHRRGSRNDTEVRI